MGRGHRSAIGTLVERSTRFLILVHGPVGTSRAEAIRDGVTAAFTGPPPNLRRTLTWDQGKAVSYTHLDVYKRQVQHRQDALIEVGVVTFSGPR